MKIGQRIKAAWRLFRSIDIGYGDKWYEVYPGTKTLSGSRINENSALTISALFAALNFLASTMATLPKIIFRRLPGGGREHAVNHPLYDRLHNKPNDFGLSSWQWIYTSIIHKYLWGNWYTYLDRKNYQNQQFIPLLPERMEKYDEATGIYTYRSQNGQKFYFPKSQILHIPHISLDGIHGQGIVYYARESLGIAKAQDEFAAHFFGQDTKAGGFVEIEGKMDETVRKGLQTDFNEKYGALGESWKAIFMTGGAKFKQNEIDAVKAQALESRQFSVVEVARWMNLPPHILRDLVRATFSNIEEQSLELVIYSLLPLVTQIEQAMNIALFDDIERRTHYVRFELKGLLRGDLKTRTEFYGAMLDRGVFNADIVLDLEDMNPQPNGLGQIYMMPLNMVNKELALSELPLTTDEEILAERIRGGLAIKHEFEEERTQKKIIQERTMALRRKITIAYKKQYGACGAQIVTAEVKEIRKAIKKTLTEKGAREFELWMDDFYPSFSKKVNALAAPLLASHAEAILPIALQEVNSEENIGIQYDKFQAQYQESFVKRHVRGSQGQLQAIINDAEEQHLDITEALETRIGEWEEKRPGKIARRESIRAENAFTRSVFALVGITQLISMSGGKPCPYCEELNGKVVGIEQPFLGAGEFNPEGADAPLNVTSNHFHPPYHDGCECSIMAVIQ